MPSAAPVLPPEAVLRLVIAPEREALYAAIDARFDAMIEAGAIEEVRALLALGLDPGLLRRCGRMACASLPLYLAGDSSLAERGRQGQDREPPLRQAADDLGSALHEGLGLGPRRRRGRRCRSRPARYTVTCVPISTTLSVGSWK